MSDFRNTILNIISTYKELIKKNLTRSERMSKIRQLGIKRTNIKAAGDLELYQMGLNIVSDLKKNKHSTQNTNMYHTYHGTKEFLHHLEKLLKYYKLKNDKIVNTNQKAACALVTAIQLLTSSNLNKEIIKQFKRHSNLVLTHGTDLQKKSLHDATHEHPELDLA